VIWSCPLLIIIALSAVTWTSTHLLDPFRPLERLAPGVPVPPDMKPLNVQVVALDWKWLFIYPDLGIATVNELALPVNVPVRFAITSSDQFNTFYAPTLAGMIYAMPTMRSELNAVLNKAGESWGYSGNYTGRGYSGMRFKLRGFEAADFDRWVAEVKSGGGSLALPNLVELVKPSERVPVIRFASVEEGLFDRALNRCVEPGKPCMVDLMRRDMEADRGHAHPHGVPTMPPGRSAEPLVGSKPKPALDKAPEEKGSGPNVTLRAEGGGWPITAVLTAGERHEQFALDALMDSGAVPRPGRGRPRLRARRAAGDGGLFQPTGPTPPQAAAERTGHPDPQGPTAPARLRQSRIPRAQQGRAAD